MKGTKHGNSVEFPDLHGLEIISSLGIRRNRKKYDKNAWFHPWKPVGNSVDQLGI